jgi:hypothetical protein
MPNDAIKALINDPKNWLMGAVEPPGLRGLKLVSRAPIQGRLLDPAALKSAPLKGHASDYLGLSLSDVLSDMPYTITRKPIEVMRQLRLPF